MDIKNKAFDVNNKTYSSLLVEYLEGTIADEMILNSFVRDLEILSITSTTLTINLKSNHGVDIFTSFYWKQLTDAIKNVFNAKLEPILVANNKVDNVKKNSKKGNKSFILDKFTFKNYVEGTFNHEVIKMVRSTVKKFGKFSPIFITSKSGLGKTHLLHAIGNEYSENGYSAMYVEPNRFTKNITNYSKLGGDSITKFIDSLKEFDVLLFDDVQNLGDRQVTLRVLFELLNSFIDVEKQIIIVSDKSPNELSGFEERFVTRFSSGLTTKIEEPSLDDLIKVLEFKLKKENLSPEKWEREALNFIARNNSSSIRSIEGAIKRVVFYTEESENIKYTSSVIQNIFKELQVDQNELTPTRIISTVSTYYKISKGEIVGKSRKANIVIARHMAIWLVRKILDLSLIDIGKLFGGRDHSTIMSSIKTIDKKMAINTVVKTAAEKIERKIKSVS